MTGSSASFEITLKNCAFFARHGVHNEEEVLGQRFFVDAVMQVSDNGALENDSIEGTVDYGVVFSVIEEIVTGRRRYLIEALALEVAKAVCNRFPQVISTTITIRKPHAAVPGILDYAAVTVTWPSA